VAEAQKILGQSAPVAGVLTDAYVAPSAAVVSSITVCNRDASSDTTFRVSVAKAGAADDPKQYIYHELPLFAADTFIATIGITLAASDVVRVYTSGASVSFNLFGVEVT
jgi:hypothetical protein